MKTELRSELFEFKKNNKLFFFTIILIGCASISIFMGVYGNMREAMMNVNADVMPLILAFAIYVGISTLEDFTSRIVVYKVVRSKTRHRVILAKYLFELLGCILMLFLYHYVLYIISVFYYGISGSLQIFLEVNKKLLLEVPFYLFIITLFFGVSIIIKKGTYAIAINVFLSIVIVVFSNTFSRGLNDLFCKIVNPFIALLGVAAGSLSLFEYIVCSIVSFSEMIILYFLSTVVFSKIELK